MSWKSSCLATVLAVFLASAAQAGDHGLLLPWTMCWPDCIKKTCCDDYCPKPAPCVPRIGCFGCDDYMYKCEPCVKRMGCFGCDSYCPKCPPVIRCAPTTGLKCVPTEPRRVRAAAGSRLRAAAQRTRPLQLPARRPCFARA